MSDRPAPAAAGGSSGHGLVTLVALVVTGMVGSGVFTTSGHALATLGSPQAVLAAWAVGGLVAIAGAVAYGALAERLPQSGGEYLYLSRAVHPAAGFVAGLVSVMAGFGGGIALAASTCERYAAPLVSLPDWLPPHAIATAVVLACGLVHVGAGPASARVNTALVAVKMAVIAALVVWGYAALGGRPGAETAAEPSRVTPGGFAATLMWIMFSYTGFNQAVYVASEAREPRRDVPRALLLGTLVTTLLYLALNDVFLRAAPAARLAGQDDVAAVAAGAIGGPTFERWMRLAIALSAFSAAAGMMMAGSRVIAAMAGDGILPRWLAGPRGVGRAVVLETVLAVALVHAATILRLLAYLGVTLSLMSALTVATLLLPGGTGSGAARPRGVQWVAAVVYVGATLGFVTLLAAHDPWQIAGAVATLAAGVVLWPLVRVGR